MRKILGVLAATALLLVGGASASSASTAAGSWKQSCYPKPGTYASLLVENYNIATGQRYKITVKGDAGPAIDVFIDEVRIDGVKVYEPSGGVVGPKVIYKDYANRSTKHTVKYQTYQGFDLFPNTCSIGPR